MAIAVATAEAAAAVLRPRGGLALPEPVASASYFSAADVLRARRFRRGQRLLGATSSAVQLGILGALARRPPAVLQRPLRHPVAASAGAGAALAAGTAAMTLPLDVLARRRALDVGLATGSWRTWAGDQAKAGAVGAAVSAAAGAGAVALRRRAGEAWWAPAAGLAAGASTILAVAAPLVLEPLFMKFDALEEGPLRRDVLELAQRSDVTVGDVLVGRASEKTTGANAYVSGLGRTRRVVLFDTLRDRFSADEVRLVVAHELSHVRHRDVLRSIGLLTLTAAPATHAVAQAVRGTDPGPASLPALALAGAAASAALAPAAARLSRAVEVRADTEALRLAGGGPAFAAFHRRIALQNVVEPQPPRLLHALLATHPTTLERIALAERFAAGDGAPAAPGRPAQPAGG